MVSEERLRRRLLAEMEDLRTVDCHSHTFSRQDYYAQGPYDLFSLLCYFRLDAENVTGRTWEELRDAAASDADRWEILKGLLERSGNTTYWRHNIVTYQRLFGMEEGELADDNWEALNRAIRERSADPQWYDYVTRDLCRLETQVRNVSWFEEWEPEYFAPTLRIEHAVQQWKPGSRRAMEKQFDRSFGDLEAVKQGVAELLDMYRRQGAVGIKQGHAFWRTLAVERVEEEDAARIYASASAGDVPGPAKAGALEDNMIHYLADLCADLGLVFQIHTGMVANWGFIPHLDPMLLLPLIHEHRKTRFDLFHAGYPYSREMGALGKLCPNVWLNMCWAYVITMAWSRQVLSEWIDLVPGERLLGFGSDVHHPELIYGHLVMARSCIADVLVEKVRRDFLSEERAVRLARMMMRENGLRLYGLPESGRNP